ARARTEAPAIRCSVICSSRSLSSAIQPRFPALHSAQCSTEHPGNHTLRRHKLSERPLPIVPPPMRRSLRVRAQQDRSSLEPAAELRGTNERRVQCVLREIRQRVTFSASKKARDDEEVEAGPSTSQTRAEPVRLRPAPRKRPTDDLDRLLDTVNDKLQR